MSRARLRACLGALLAAFLVASPAVQPAQATGDSARYASAATAVARANGQNAVDEGAVVCDGGNDVGAGGTCLAFGGGDSVHVVDDAAGENVAFQVCLDNNGDGVCTSPEGGSCGDQVFFSHDDAGNFRNPLGPLPTSFKSGCDGGPWKGYVVMLCEGAHAVGADVHAHGATTGTSTVTSGGEGLGTFCGGWGAQPTRKPYKVGSGARYVSGGTAAARANGQTVVDEGAMSCNGGDNVGVGGFCVSFGGGDAIAVYDDLADMDVAFQVCVDNNADGVCTSPDTSWGCPDRVYFSHDDAGNFFNPLGPLPTGFDTGCGFGAPWQGYVVFLCEGSHVAGLDAHAHPATSGNGRVTTGGEGLGTFCGGTSVQPSRKRYAPPRVSADPSNPCGLLGVTDAVAGEGQVSGTLNVGPTTAAQLGLDPLESVAVTCFVTVDGAAQPGASVTASGTGVVAGSSVVTFTLPSEDSAVNVCFTATSGSGGSTSGCEPATTTALGGAGGDAAAPVEQLAHEVGDPAGCPLFAALAPGVPGVVDINSQGDVFLNGQPVLDCPPYDLGLPPLSGSGDDAVLVTNLI